MFRYLGFTFALVVVMDAVLLAIVCAAIGAEAFVMGVQGIIILVAVAVVAGLASMACTACAFLQWMMSPEV